MKYILRAVPSVTREARRVYEYREKHQGKGSGDRFLKALGKCYEVILANPYAYQLRKDPFRHAQLHRLKYRVVFKVEGQLISVVQVRHTSRTVSKRYGP